MSAGGASGGGRVVGPAETIAHGDVAGSKIDENFGDE